MDKAPFQYMLAARGSSAALGGTVSESDPLEVLQKLEKDLHQPETRRSKSRLEALLHPSFIEIGLSGREFPRQDVIDELHESTEYPSVVASDFALHRISDVWLDNV